MTDQSLAEILSGKEYDEERADLHAALDLLLDDASRNNGQLNAPAFWAFVSSLAENRGIADELGRAAALMLVENRPDKAVSDLRDDPTDLFRVTQFAGLFHLLGRLQHFGSAVLPPGFCVPAWRGVLLNLLRPGPGTYVDLLGLNSSRGGDGMLARLARRQLVLAVYYRAAKDGIRESEARRYILPEPGCWKDSYRTWQGWRNEVTKDKDMTVAETRAEAEAAARGEIDETPYDLDEATVAELWRLAYRPRKK